MKSQNPDTNAENIRKSILQSDVAEESRRNGPTLDAIHRRKLEIHVERGDHRCDVDEFLEEWAQAERELEEKYNKSNDGRPK